ncbi:hypothetical protein HDE_04798 [Halotydeus destructor]|nr:hypothetical protein HDE_04798 [Halotydeus destructor]
MAFGVIFAVVKWAFLVILVVQLIVLILNGLCVTDSEHMSWKGKSISLFRIAIFFCLSIMGVMGAWLESSDFLWIYCIGVAIFLIYSFVNNFAESDFSFYDLCMPVAMVTISAYLAFTTQAKHDEPMKHIYRVYLDFIVVFIDR